MLVSKRLSLRANQRLAWQSHPLGFRLLRRCAPRNDGRDVGPLLMKKAREVRMLVHGGIRL